MSSNYTLEELLSLALGTPEIGAVNFNYLFEVLREILKHLGISHKISGNAADEAEFCAQPRSNPTTPLPDLQEEQSEAQILTATSSHSNGMPSAGSDDDKALESKKSNGEKGEETQKQASQKKDSESEKRHSSRRQSIASSSPSPPPPKGPSSRRASNVSAGFSERKMSQFAPPGEGTSNHDFILVNRSLDRRDSKTPAGDMWHVLNINRRLEAAEATIQGMTNLIDNVSSDVTDLKDNVRNIEENNNEMPGDIAVPTLPEGTDTSGEMRAYNEQLKKLSKAIKETEESLKKSATKEDIKELCSVSMVEEMIEEKIEKLSPQPPASKSLTKTPSATAEQPAKRKESRSKLFQEVLSRVMALEEAGIFVNEELERIKAALSAKADSQNEDFMDKITTEIQLLSKEIEKLQISENDVNNFKGKLEMFEEESKSLKTSTDYNAKEQGTIMKNVFKIEQNLDALTDTVHLKLGTVVKTQASQADSEALSKMKSLMNGLQEQHNLVENELHRIDKELMKTMEKTIILEETAEHLKETKLDKDCLDKQLLLKADKKELRNKITQDKFDSSLGILDRNLQDALQRVDGQDCILKQFLLKIDARFEKKLDRDDLLKLQEYIEKRFKSFKVTAPEPMLPDDTAAGFRKPLLRNFHCISCDQPLELLQEDAIPSLPVCQALPGTRAIRPYTTFELEQIRKHMRGDGSNKDRFEMAHERERLQKQLLRLSGAHDLDDLAARTSRSCGGSHTLLDPQKRSFVKATMLYREDSLQIQAAPEPVLEGEVMGRDGHIYKGRMEHLPPLKQKDRSMSPTSQTEVPIMARPSLQRSGAEVGPQQLAAMNKA